MRLQADRPLGKNSLAAIAAAAICVGNAFRYVTGDQRACSKYEVLSLWAPDQPEEEGPELNRFLDMLWLVGIGNLGQAFLWAISSLYFTDPNTFKLMLQDFDRVTSENWGTSLLLPKRTYGDLKTAIGERWSTNRGFMVSRIDRAVDEYLHRHPSEPLVALAGLDKVKPREWLGQAGFSKIIDVGLGATHTDYTKIRLTVFDEDYKPAGHFGGIERPEPNLAAKEKLKGYQAIEAKKGRCGVEEYVGHSIAYTFVSAIAACLALTQCVRLCMGEATYRAIVVDSADLRSVRAQVGKKTARVGVGSVHLA